VSHGGRRAGQCDVSSGARQTSPFSFHPFASRWPSSAHELLLRAARARHWQPPGAPWGLQIPRKTAQRAPNAVPTSARGACAQVRAAQHAEDVARRHCFLDRRSLRTTHAIIDKRWGQRYPSSLFQGSFRHGRPRERSRRTVLILEAVQAPNVLGTVSSGREASRRVACGRSNLGYNTRHPPHAAPSPTTRTCALDGLLTRLSWGVRGQRKQLHVVRASTARHKQIDDMRLRLCESRWGGRQACPSAISSSKSETVSPPCGGMLIASWADG
jgi:hypothetical protein